MFANDFEVENELTFCFFYEQYPELHLIAVGSLLEFALSELPSYGVGRVSSLFLYPFSFAEFLRAANAELLRKTITEASPKEPFPEAIHTKALELYKQFLVLGGMPKVISSYFQVKIHCPASVYSMV